MIALDGCRTEPLGSYLQGLGVWRAVCRLRDPAAKAHWESGRLILTCDLDRESLVAALLSEFSPLPLVSPWNRGSGFAGNGKSAAAERALAAIRDSTESGLADLREAVAAADRVVARGRALGWAGSASEFWDKRHKTDIVRLCRNMLPDEAIAWLDAAVVLGQDAKGQESVSYNSLLGTGGNFGRQDLQATYIQRVFAILKDKKTSIRSEGWLRAALYGDESTPYLRETVGQFDPGRAGGIQSSPKEKADDDDKGFANPWAFLFTVEGSLLFASAATRRLGARSSGAAIPFVVRATPLGFGSGAADEKAVAEVWTPQWERPAGLAEIRQLLGEGRAEWNGRPAQNGLDFVRAVSTLGVDRGVRRFTRHLIAERLGQSPLAVPIDTIEVQERRGVGLLRDVDRWLGRVRAAGRPGAVEAALRRVDAAMYEVGRTRSAGLRAVLIALGHLHETVARSGAVSGRVPPLTLRSVWWHELCRPGEASLPLEMRLAGALASGRDGAERWPMLGLRRLLSPVAPNARGVLAWTDRPPSVHIGAGVAAALADVHRRRARPGAVPDPGGRSGHQDDIDKAPAIKGTFSAFVAGLSVTLADAVALGTGQVDLDQLRNDLIGLLLLDWSDVEQAGGRGILSSDLHDVIPPVLALLLPFYADRPLRVQLHDEDVPPSQLVLRPDQSWPSRLAAGEIRQIRAVTDDAADRLRAAGVRRPVTPVVSDVDGSLLAAALLLRVPISARVAALRRVADLPAPNARPAETDFEPEGVPA